MVIALIATAMAGQVFPTFLPVTTWAINGVAVDGSVWSLERSIRAVDTYFATVEEDESRAGR